MRLFRPLGQEWQGKACSSESFRVRAVHHEQLSQALVLNPALLISTKGVWASFGGTPIFWKEGFRGVAWWSQEPAALEVGWDRFRAEKRTLSDAPPGAVMRHVLETLEAVFAELWRISAESGMSNCIRTCSG